MENVGPVTALLRVRVVLVALAMAVVAAASGAIFDQWIATFAIAIVLPMSVTLAAGALPLVGRMIAGTLGVFASVALVVAIEGGTFGDTVDAVIAGTQRLLTTEWPSPLRPDLVGAVALLLAIATAVATELASRRRTHLAAWLPVIASVVAVVALSAPVGTRLLWLLPLGLLGAVFATLRPNAGLADRWATLRGERRMVPLLLIAGSTAAALSIPVALAVRADPRRNDPPAQTTALLDPIESSLALRRLDPVVDLHEVALIDGAVLPTRWRTAALSEYDGQRWRPALTLRPIGRRLAPDAPDQVAVEVTFLDDGLSLVPLPGLPITVDAPVETDIDRTVVRVVDRPGTEPLSLTAQVAPSIATAQTTGVATRPVDDSVTSLNEFAADLAGDGTVLEQLLRIESTMRNDWILQSDAPGGGLQRTLIERFLRDTQRGTAEQFATSYVLLARSLGVDARVATGFVAGTAPADGRTVLTSADARVWPEVRLVGGGWVALDPVPPEENSDDEPPPEEPAVQTPAAPQPPIVAPPEVSNDTSDDDQAAGDDQILPLSAIRLWAQRIGLGLTALLVPTLLAMMVILGIKRRRRRSRLRGTPIRRVAGAWAIATDRLVDAGLTIGSSATDGDIAASGVPMVEGAERELRRLATLSSAVTFGHPARPDMLAEDAATCLRHVERTMADRRTRMQRLAWQLSLRSLRRSTRSPVTG